MYSHRLHAPQSCGCETVVIVVVSITIHCFLLFSNSLDLLNAACEEMSQRKEKMLQTQNHFDIRPQVSPVSIFSFFSYMFKLPVPKTGTCAPV